MRTLLLVCLLACGKSEKAAPSGGGAAPTPSGPTVTWKGTWTHTEPPNMPGGGTMTVVAPAGGGAGTITAEHSLCIKPDTPITVAIEGNNVKMNVSAGETTASYTATIAGNEMTGEATVTCAPGTGKASFKLTKQ